MRSDVFQGLRLGLGRLRLYREKKTIAAPYDGLDDALANCASHVTEVSAEKAFADDDVLSPCRFNQLLLSHEALRMCGQIPQDHEWLAPQLDLRIVPEESLVPDVEPERAEAANLRRATVPHGRATAGKSVSLGARGAEIEASALRDDGATEVVENIGRLPLRVGCSLGLLSPWAVRMRAALQALNPPHT